MICSWVEWIPLKKQAIRSKKTLFSHVFDSFPPSLCQKSESLPSIFPLFLQIDGIDLLSSLFKKERRERLTFFHDWIDLSLFWSQKPAIRSKIRCSNSQPCQDGGRVCVWAHALSGLGGFKIPMSSRLMAALLLLLLSFLLSPNRSRTIDQSIYSMQCQNLYTVLPQGTRQYS